MQDEEYPEYLKKQSYEDLVLISYSIDQVRQPKRYAMAIAEIDRRDKCGEGKDSPNDTKRYRKYPLIALGALFAFSGLFDLDTGRSYGKWGHYIARSQHPVEFWIIVVTKFVPAIICLLGLFRAKR